MALRGGQGSIEGARLAGGSPSLRNARGVIVGYVEWCSRVYSGVLDRGHGSKHGCDSQWRHATLRGVPWGAPGSDLLGGWSAKVGVRLD